MRAADERASESPDPAKIGVRPGAKWKNISIMYNSLINCGPSGDGMAENRIKRIILSEYAPNGILRRIQTIQITCMKKLLIFFLPAILLGCDSPAYRNPLDVAFGDPFILHAADGKFYMYGTSGDIRGFRVCVSDDLVTWQKGDVVYDEEKPGTHEHRGGDELAIVCPDEHAA